MVYNREQLIQAYQQNNKIKYLFFWGHTPQKDGSIGKSCFSQWWVAPFTVEGVVYQTAEHWMMAEKARLFKDNACLKAIIASPSPAEAKQWGRNVKGFTPAVWNAHKYNIVKQGNCHKFLQHPELKAFLKGTKNRVLVEASPRDQIWGIGLSASHENVENPILWKGENLLGFALMEVREILK